MLRSSKYCEGYAVYDDGKIKYSCESNIELLSEKQYNFYNCDFYDMEEYAQCYQCPLSCKNNKSIVKKAKSRSKEQANRILDSILEKYPVSQNSVDVARKNLDRELDPASIESIKTIKLVDDILNKAMSGHQINLPLISRIAKIIKTQNKS